MSHVCTKHCLLSPCTGSTPFCNSLFSVVLVKGHGECRHCSGNETLNKSLNSTPDETPCRMHRLWLAPSWSRKRSCSLPARACRRSCCGQILPGCDSCMIAACPRPQALASPLITIDATTSAKELPQMMLSPRYLKLSPLRPERKNEVSLSAGMPDEMSCVAASQSLAKYPTLEVLRS